MHKTERPVIGTIGLKFKVDVNFDISTGTAFKIHYVKPDGTFGNFVGIYEFIASKHMITYVTTNANDIDQEGQWTMQAYVEMGTNKFWGAPVKTERFQDKLS